MLPQSGRAVLARASLAGQTGGTPPLRLPAHTRRAIAAGLWPPNAAFLGFARCRLLARRFT
eukprot:196956-Alexandrium_andersonii.AAC.1